MKKFFDFTQLGLAETLLPSRIIEPTAWIGHIPFAYYIIEKTKPKIIIELGVHTGNSFFAFADAIKALDLPCTLIGIDTFRGDKHAGYFGDEVYEDVSKFLVENYPNNIALLKSTFDDAVDTVKDGSIDILHIDGCHTYEETRHNFDTWKSKVKIGGFILFHDTMIFRDDFGVYKLWQEFEKDAPKDTFNFIHSCGLGVLKHGGGEWQFNDTERALKCFEDLGETIYQEYNFGKRMDRNIKPERLEGERKICLTFICRDNKDTIQRMIKSCAPIVDCVVACDTGSVDNTKELIEQTCTELALPYEIHSDDWKNFGHNRTLMMQYARPKAEYSFVMDTDETLEIKPGFDKKKLKEDVLTVPTSDGNSTYYRDKFFKNTIKWKWIGAAHEFASGPGATTKGKVEDLNLKLYPKANNNHIERNYNLLTKDYERNPLDSRTLFYLGESAYDLGKNDEALEYYGKRVKIDFFPEEGWYAQYKIGKIYERLKNYEEAEGAFLRAYSKRPTRMEPMFDLAYMLAQKGDNTRACVFYEMAMKISYPKEDMLFIQDYLYNYYCAFNYCIALFYSNRLQDSFNLAEKIADELKDKMPADVYNRHLLNIMYCEINLKKQGWKERFVICPADLRFDGLGDNAFHSHLAGLAKKAGYKKVYLSSLMKFKTPGTKEVIYLNNPDVDGEIERYGMKCEDPWAKGILSGEVPTHDIEYMKLIALSHGFYEEGVEYLPQTFTIPNDIEWRKLDGLLFDGYGKTNIVSEEKIRAYFDKFGLPSWQITIDNTNSDVKHGNAILKRIYLEGIEEIHVKDLSEYICLLRGADNIICLTSATAILHQGKTIVLTDTAWLNNAMAKCHMRKENKYINLDTL